MNRSKKIYVLLGILVVVSIAAFGVSKYEEEKEVIKNSGEVILEVSTEDVTAVSWKNTSDALSFHKGEAWTYDADEAFPVDEEKINELLQQFESFGVSFIIEEVEDFAQYGLDDPVAAITIETSDTTYEILLGDYSTMDSERYVSIGDGNVYLAVNDPLDVFDATLSEVIKHDTVPTMETVNRIEFSGSESYEIAYEAENNKTYCEDDVYFTEQNGSSQPLDTDLVEDYLQTITSMELSEYMTYNATEEELETYGLDDPELTVSIEYTCVDDATEEEVIDTFVLSISREPAQKVNSDNTSLEEAVEETEASDSEEEIPAYVRIGESGIIYKITSDKYEALMAASYDELRHQEVFSGDFEDVYQMDISLENVDYTITSKVEDENRIYSYGEEEVELADFKSAMNDLEAESFTDEEPTQKEEIGLKLYLDNENHLEVTIDLYRYDGNNCLAVVDGEPVSLIPRSKVVDLIETVNAIVLN